MNTRILTPDGGRPLSNQDIALINQSLDLAEAEARGMQEGVYIIEGCEFTVDAQSSLNEISEGTLVVVDNSGVAKVVNFPLTTTASDYLRLTVTEVNTSTRELFNGSGVPTRSIERVTATDGVDDPAANTDIYNLLHKDSPLFREAKIGRVVLTREFLSLSGTSNFGLILRPGWAIRSVAYSHDHNSSISEGSTLTVSAGALGSFDVDTDGTAFITNITAVDLGQGRVRRDVYQELIFTNTGLPENTASRVSIVMERVV